MANLVINPPPADKRCECCGRHWNDLPVFGSVFRGARLIKTFRGTESIGASWECHDCAPLSDRAYRRIIANRSGAERDPFNYVYRLAHAVKGHATGDLFFPKSARCQRDGTVQTLDGRVKRPDGDLLTVKPTDVYVVHHHVR